MLRRCVRPEWGFKTVLLVLPIYSWHVLYLLEPTVTTTYYNREGASLVYPVGKVLPREATRMSVANSQLPLLSTNTIYTGSSPCPARDTALVRHYAPNELCQTMGSPQFRSVAVAGCLRSIWRQLLPYRVALCWHPYLAQ